ncbi:hypothetical protein DY000_02039588 [Brassica cretica]|uniref:Uncharacterized protein n=1 Tax=Brassica cretica TaxID=69181 RepID=A0ABQ7B9E4_BRACR|nr:hypothetical protein DY000_02039588 [Brassica cretica]
MIPKQKRRSRSSTRVIRFWTDLINQRDLDRNGWMDRSAPHQRWKARDTTQGSQGRGADKGYMILKQERRSRSSTRVIRFWTDLINQRDLDRNGWMDRSAPHQRWKARDTTQGSQGRGGTGLTRQ